MISGENRVTWKDDIRRALSEIGRDATTSEIYERVEKNREQKEEAPRLIPDHWSAGCWKNMVLNRTNTASIRTYS